MKIPWTYALSLFLFLGCASPIRGPLPQRLALDNGSSVQLDTLSTTTLPGEEIGLLIAYVTELPIRSAAVEREVGLVWHELLPELRRRGVAQGLLLVMPSTPEAGPQEVRIWRACLTKKGETLWLKLDGSVEYFDLAASKWCAQSPAPLRTTLLAPVR
jgi:hypothetical protein